MKVFADTNVLVSAVATRGLCADVLREVLASHDLKTSQEVLNEVGQTLRAKFGVPPDAADEYVRLLEQNSVVAKTAPLPGINLADRDDLAILGAALASGADVFVTGDLELQELQAVGRLQILSPRGFWNKLRSRQPQK